MSFEFSNTRPFRRATAWTGAALVAATLGVAGWQAGGARAETPASPQAKPDVGPRPGIHGAITSYADAVARVSPAVVTVRVENKASVEPTRLPGRPVFPPVLRRSPARRQAASRAQRGLGSGVIVSRLMAASSQTRMSSKARTASGSC